MSDATGTHHAYTRQEMMAIATGREIRDGELAIFGVGLSMLAGYFAKACHAPDVRAMTEGGVYGSSPVGGLPWGIECNRLSTNATSFTSALDALGCFVASGRCDVGIIGAAEVDKFGNVNTTGIWGSEIGEEYRPPKTRLTGAGGANDIASGAKRVVIMVAHEKKRFTERVAYISSPGYLDGADTRSRAGFVGGGPSAIITTLGILRPHPESKEFELDGWFAFSGIDEVRAATGWDLKVSPAASPVPEPTAAELAALRRVDETGALRRRDR
ncbi:CoA-transferase subunit beta [Blastochloris viridis]|uniref:3-oxoadipate CoA-transferase subunit B n=1 Tax=Blastochloris viridis TaxID=1079 RepID=A0A0H5BEU8_BLAVI|nr:CoA-transferase [Blastochloris viridis]ALK09370.1 3-oxoadipate CoA-transferase subunit B [Blastochloris viridis]BAS00751.1 3-oxoadipate CoA-transferase subunit B [Blastochloris viridis]CUU42033.1 3-oxoadipate CoA-transferase subunit B [Blastochloris viridis]